MAIPLSDVVLEEKNKLYEDQAWLVLLHITNPEETQNLRLCLNTEDVLFDGDIYLKSNFEIGTIPEATSGTLPKIPLKVQNVDRVMGQLVENDPNFGSNWKVNIMIVNQKHLGVSPEYDPIDIISNDFVVIDVTTTFSHVVFNLGVKNPMRIQFPAGKYNPASCQRTFNNKFTGCDYANKGKSGTSFTQCSKTIEDCQARFDELRTNNEGKKIGLPFFAFQGLSRRAIIKV